MTLRAPLTVRINDGYTDRHVTAHASRLSFRKTAPGGYHSLQVHLDLPRDFFRDLGPADRITIYDARTAAVVFEGLTENPGAGDGPAGQSYDLAAMGTLIYAQDESRALIYIDRDLSSWFPGRSTAASSSAAESSDPLGTAGDGVLVQFNPGQPLATNAIVPMAYHRLEDVDMTFGALAVTTKSGKNDTGYRTELAYSDGISSGTVALSSALQISTTPVTNGRYVDAGAGHPPGGVTRIAVRLRRDGGATNVADDDTWTLFYDIAVLAQRMDRYGALLTDVTGMVSNQYVRADWVVDDLLGRVLTMCDPSAAVVDVATYQIDQLAYPDKATAQRVLDDLTLWEPDFLWELGETLPSGKVRFAYRQWPTTARYEVSSRRDVYRAPGGEVDLCNRIAVFWTDATGATQTTPVTRSVPELGGAPGDPGARIKDAEPITLPPGKGSAANAQRAGEQELAAKADPPTSATVVVRRRLHDHLTGRTVAPWELEPGYLARVIETGELLRITEMAYDDDAAATTLTLGEPVLSTEQRLARLQAKVALGAGR